LFHQSPLVQSATSGYALNPSINGGDYWSSRGQGNYNAMIAELKHQFSHQFMADAQFTWAKSMDDISAPYTEQDYPYDPHLTYGPSDYDVSKSFKLFGMWQPVLFHGNNKWMEKIAGGWSLSGIFNLHSGFPWTPVLYLPGTLYCNQCGYYQVYPAAYLGGAGSSTSNKAFESPATSNFPLVATQGNALSYFSEPAQCSATVTTDCYTLAGGTALPPNPGVHRNSLRFAGYKDIDLTLAKSFGLPNMPVLGENAKFELRLDAYNLFNSLNLNPNSISNNIGASNFGTITSDALAGRVVTFGMRFSF
jgi:hypothetical protein